VNTYTIALRGPARSSASGAAGLKRFVAAAALLAVSATWAQDIRYNAIDLTDSTPGKDLWQVDYTVAGPLGEWASLNLLFATAKYGPISVLAAPGVLGVTTLDSILGFDGQATITATEALPATFTGKVSLSFVWTGAGTPGPQPFEVLSESFNVIGNGSTTPVPEPATAWLLLAGVGVVGAALRCRRAAAVR